MTESKIPLTEEFLKQYLQNLKNFHPNTPIYGNLSLYPDAGTSIISSAPLTQQTTTNLFTEAKLGSWQHALLRVNNFIRDVNAQTGRHILWNPGYINPILNTQKTLPNQSKIKNTDRSNPIEWTEIDTSNADLMLNDSQDWLPFEITRMTYIKYLHMCFLWLQQTEWNVFISQALQLIHSNVPGEERLTFEGLLLCKEPSSNTNQFGTKLYSLFVSLVSKVKLAAQVDSNKVWEQRAQTKSRNGMIRALVQQISTLENDNDIYQVRFESFAEAQKRFNELNHEAEWKSFSQHVLA